MNIRGLMAAGLAITMAACSARPKKSEMVTMAPEWEAVFTRTDGWTGADGAATIPLPGRRLLWLFGDTFIGPVREGRHAEGTTMVNNTIAVSPMGSTPGPIEFFWDASGSRPAAWAIPVQAGEWFWPASGGVVASGPDGRDRLHLFMARISRIDRSDSIWNFRARGTTLLTVENPAEPPARWRMSRETLTTLPTGPGARLLMWGSGAVVVPGRDMGAPEVLILGIDETNTFNKKLVVARAPLATLNRFETWSFNTGSGYSSMEADAAPVLQGMSSELSIHRIRLRGRDVLLLVYSEAMLGPGIMARTCLFPEGEWSEAAKVYVCPEPAGDRRLMVYSAKAHPEVSEPGEVLISYSVNSTDFGDVLAHADRYRPRFVRVPLTALPEAPR